MAPITTKNVQSPIALDQRRTVIADGVQPLEYFGHWDGLGKASMVNTGSSVMITFTERPYRPFIVGGVLGNKYIFEQLHFHWGTEDGSGCEHTLEGSTYSMEAHAVHYNAKHASFAEAVDKPDGLAVVGFFVQAYGTEDCPAFGKMVAGLRHITQPNARVDIDADCLSWIGMQELNRHYYTYRGSLTTPPYFESVTWLVYKTPVYVSSAQVAAFRQLQACPNDNTKKIVNNFRSVQTPEAPPAVAFVRNNHPTAVLSKL
ncbi:carbonic anhydrase 2 [Anopheles darlingi]|uniref:carbonic anhydrase 2 n=1 Tax=Anopheles darlingi TaxID=43151 RepID=UPI00210023BC|nr:carbonic anhydrase 2 [Anopheles darlingi]